MTHQKCSHLDFGNSQIVCASNASTTLEDRYQPGWGNVGSGWPTNLARVHNKEATHRGKNIWTELRGSRDTGVFVVSTYQVSQPEGSNSGPTMA